MHEFVIRGDLAPGVDTIDVAKRLIDYGFHPPIVYFPLLVTEAMLIEPTETESKETLDAFAQAMINIVVEAQQETELPHSAPHTTPVGRLDQVTATRRPPSKEYAHNVRILGSSLTSSPSKVAASIPQTICGLSGNWRLMNARPTAPS